MTGTLPPVWLLDVDGVINGHPHHAGWGDPPKRVSPGPVYYEPRLIDRIRAIHAAGMAEVRWCTTWCDFRIPLAKLEQALDVEFERAFTVRPMSKTWAELKTEAAVAVLEGGRRLVWTDDDEADVASGFYPVLGEAVADGRALLIAPDSNRGLQPEHLELIEEFASDVEVVA